MKADDYAKNEESIINSILRAETLEGRDGNIRRAIPIKPLERILEKYKTDISNIINAENIDNDL